MAVAHPFYPRKEVIAHYQPKTFTMTEILGVFFSVVFLVLIAAWTLASNTPASSGRKSMTLGTRLVFIWFVCCGGIHGIVEGYFAWNAWEIAGQSHFLADLWKEYAMSDSRYMTRDAFVVVMESMTAALWGPLSLVAAFMIYKNNPARHLLQFLISTGQLYGDVAYYGTAAWEGYKHSSPHPYYFWFYFVFMNAFWIVIPAAIMVSSGSKIVKGLMFLDERKKGGAPAAGKKKTK
ncbi:hypothetical protein HDV05_004066 [Chytridiales sp. JEL 0842]|nr:hypothetical protein HDV05_004066 [Chytridiales sp. JEL 0842]